MTRRDKSSRYLRIFQEGSKPAHVVASLIRSDVELACTGQSWAVILGFLCSCVGVAVFRDGTRIEN